MTDHAAHPESKLWDFIEGIRTAMMTTSRGGAIESRPMTAHVERDAKLIWFITPLDTHKTDEIGAGEAINLAFVDMSDQIYVSVEGQGTVVRDVAKQKELWSAFAEAWMPAGPEDSNTGLIRVEPVRATYWDSPSSTARTLWDVAKANITQTPPTSGETRTVDLR